MHPNLSSMHASSKPCDVSNAESSSTPQISWLLVFAGPVCWTEKKKTKIKLNPTAKDWTTSCSCTNSENFWLPVARFVEKLKNQKNRSFIPSCVGPYSCTHLPNCRSLNHKKMVKNWLRYGQKHFYMQLECMSFRFCHISAKS